MKLLRQLTQRKRPHKKPVSAAAKKEEQKAESVAQENPLMKQIRAKMPAFMKKPKAKLGFDALMFVGSCVVVVSFGKFLHDSLDSIVPSEKEIVA